MSRRSIARACTTLAVLGMFGAMTVFHSQIWDPFLAR
jgi:hypothetical protein